MIKRLDFVLLAVFALLFSVVPQLDLWVSSLFHDTARGFFLRGNPLVRAIYDGTDLLSIFIGAGILAALIGGALFRRSLLARHRHRAAFLLVALIVGPGLVVNGLFKSHWGRARPVHTVQFGGEHPFSPPLQPANACDRNCSFVSGHASIGFLLMAPAFLSARRQRVRWLAGGVAAGLVIGAVRIVQGGHYLSDVLFCGSIVWFCLRGVHYAFQQVSADLLLPIPAVQAAAPNLVRPELNARSPSWGRPIQSVGRPLLRVAAAVSGAMR